MPELAIFATECRNCEKEVTYSEPVRAGTQDLSGRQARRVRCSDCNTTNFIEQEEVQ
jgi:hypothetical protein